MRMLAKPGPLRFRELHPLPVVIARFILRAEALTPRLRRRAFCRSDMRLELHGVGTGARDRIDEGMCDAEAAVMRLRDLADDRAGSADLGIVQPGTGHGLLCCSKAELPSISRRARARSSASSILAIGPSTTTARGIAPRMPCPAESAVVRTA